MLLIIRCDMIETVRGIVENFLFMVSTYGLVPNGGRIYYTKRSQPPFLTMMVREFMNKTAEIDWLREHLPTLESEMNFWETNRCTEVNGHKMFVFGTGGTGPRPESYREDVEMAQENFDNDEDMEEFYFHMKAGAESGWDYSTRWMIDVRGRNKGTLKDVKTNFIVPVDLNCLMYMNYMNLAEFHSLLGDAAKSEANLEKAEKMMKAVKDVFWDEEDKMWYDYDMVNNLPRKYFFPSNLFPLWAECYDPNERMIVAESAVEYLKKTGCIYCKGGIPTSLDMSGQQWDFPNAWPPLQHILVSGLLKTEHSEARKMALTIARRYTQDTMFSCPEGAEVCNMYEKYNVIEQGSAGGGGEYDVQTGFGWSNGVVFEFMALFGDELLSGDPDEDYDSSVYKESVELNTQFNVDHGKSKLVRKESNINVSVDMEKHELETSEKEELNKLQHPVLTIEEDDDEGDDEDDDVLDADQLNNIKPYLDGRSDRSKKMSVKIAKGNSKRLAALFEG